FIFNKSEYHFVRGTENPKIVYESNEKYEKLHSIDVNDYTENLKRLYELNADKLSFRSIVSNYSRVWGKENNDVKKPLHSSHKQTFSQAITI
ncbi:hypothetical protein, partial [Bacillus subtilis]|uniref:hypothetical protein n=1 Tax=Bacillus subtilis TaxID=1423 RepID=UPI003CC911DC